MSLNINSLLKQFLFNGLFFACFMAGVDYFNGRPFHLIQFLVFFAAFGVLWTVFEDLKKEKIK